MNTRFQIEWIRFLESGRALRNGREGLLEQDDGTEEASLRDNSVGAGQLAQRNDQVRLGLTEDADQTVEALRVSDGDTGVNVWLAGRVNRQRDLLTALDQELVVDPGTVVLTQREDAELVDASVERV